MKTSSSLEPQTQFKWAKDGAGTAAPGKGECAWADRGPREGEVKADGVNVIYGFLNQLANLPDGKFGADYPDSLWKQSPVEVLRRSRETFLEAYAKAIAAQ